MYKSILDYWRQTPSGKNQKSQRFPHHRPLRFERFEDRRMLAAMADLLFVADESGSEQNTHTQDWLATVIDDLAATMAAANIDARYGLIGFGQGQAAPNQNTPRYAHSQLLGVTGNKGLWSTNATHLTSAINNDLESTGGSDSEDGWDALEHAIAEYDFRDGAVPIVVLVQGDEGRRNLNDTLTRDGILAALESRNVLFNTLIAGELLSNGEPPVGEVLEPITHTNLSWAPIFNLATYGLDSDIYVLGVEADAADGVPDGQHDYHAFGLPFRVPTTEAEALQVSYNGSNTGATGMVGSGKSILIGQNISDGIGATTAGYSAKSVPFGIVDMTGATEVTNLANSISYSFPFYGTTHGSLWVNEDGTISFNSANTSGDNVDLTQPVSGQTRPSNPTIAALWDDLQPAYFPLAGQVLTKLVDVDGDAQNDLVIQWTDYAYAADFGIQDPISFQAVLYSDGRIRFNYLDIDSYPDNSTEVTIKNTGGVTGWIGESLALAV